MVLKVDFFILFVQAGYRAIPSPRQPGPGKDKYYRGGYITQVIKMDSDIVVPLTGANEQCCYYFRPTDPEMEILITTNFSSKNHGSTSGGVVDAIQLELPVDLISSTEYR